MSSGPFIYLRVKRRNQTYCFLCDDTDTILDVKRQILLAAVQHRDDKDDDKGKSDMVELPSNAKSLQLLLPAGSNQEQPQDDDNDDDDDQEMGDDNDGTKTTQRSAFLKDNETLGTVRGKTMAPGKEESELVLHLVFPVADNEWESVDVEPTVIQDSS